MKCWLRLGCVGLVAALVGCVESVPAGNGSAVQPAAELNEAASATVAAPAEPVADSPAAPAPAAEEAAGKTVELTPANTKIEFTGIHSGDKPDPRKGSFQQFTGKAVIEGTLKSVSVEIETASLVTEIEKLTIHLKSPDFFDVNQFPKATFHSTSIKDNGDGTVEITGDLTLLDNTNSITFPATVSTEGELTLKADFQIDRTRWGMNFGVDKIEKEVPMTITIGG